MKNFIHYEKFCFKTPTFIKAILTGGDHIKKVNPKSLNRNFCDHSIACVNKANGSEIIKKVNSKYLNKNFCDHSIFSVNKTNGSKIRHS